MATEDTSQPSDTLLELPHQNGVWLRTAPAVTRAGGRERPAPRKLEAVIAPTAEVEVREG